MGRRKEGRGRREGEGGEREATLRVDLGHENDDHQENLLVMQFHQKSFKIVVYLNDKAGWTCWSLFNPPSEGHADKQLQ